MAQQQQRDVPQDQLCPPNKRFELMDANKMFDLVNLQFPNKSKILANILINHPLRLSIVGFASVPWIYISQFWHTLKEDRSKYPFKFSLGTKVLTMNVADFRRIFQLPQAIHNNHAGFVDPPTFGQMVQFFCHNLANLIPYPRFTKIIIDYYMTENLDISHTIHDNYHIVQNDDLVKNIFNSGKNKDGAGMKIPDWMLTEAMKLTDHYKMYVVVFWVDVPTTQSQPIESTEGTHRTPSAPRSPNPVTTKGESSAPCKSTNVEQVKEHIVDEEIDHLLDETKNVDVFECMSDIFNNQEDPGTRIDLGSYKESPEVENDANMVIVNANEEEEESGGDKFELRRRVKGNGIEETRSSPPPTTIRSLRTHVAPLSTDKETL
ncbi:hypothetical protein Tco_0453048 [Tanacetum coccineum]